MLDHFRAEVKSIRTEENRLQLLIPYRYRFALAQKFCTIGAIDVDLEFVAKLVASGLFADQHQNRIERVRLLGQLEQKDFVAIDDKALPKTFAEIHSVVADDVQTVCQHIDGQQMGSHHVLDQLARVARPTTLPVMVVRIEVRTGVGPERTGLFVDPLVFENGSDRTAIEHVLAGKVQSREACQLFQ